RRRHRVLRARRREDRPRRPLHQRAARRVSACEEGGDRHEDRRDLPADGRRPAARGERAARLGGDRARVGGRRDPARHPRRPAARAHARVAAALPRRRGHRRDDRAPHRRAHPRGRPRGGLRRAAALARRDGRRHRRARRQGTRRGLRQSVGGARQPEGHRDRQGRRPPAGGGGARPRRHRASAGLAGVPLAAREGRPQLAARPQAPHPAGFLRRSGGIRPGDDFRRRMRSRPAAPRTVRAMFRPLTTPQLVVDAIIGILFFLLTSLVMFGSGSAAWGGGGFVWMVPVVLGMSLALTLRRLAPGLALTIAWVTAILQMAAGVVPNPADVATFAVVYTAAAYGSSRTRWLSFASAFVAPATITAYILITQGIGEL